MRETTHTKIDRAVRNQRTRTIVLGLLGALLVLDGAPQQLEVQAVGILPQSPPTRAPGETSP